MFTTTQVLAGSVVECWVRSKTAGADAGLGVVSTTGGVTGALPCGGDGVEQAVASRTAATAHGVLVLTPG
ncbi:hypothetical protein GCM10009795_011470 [Nocardioides hankookensis]